MSLIFLHGAGCTGEVFERQRAAFPNAHAPNLPGHAAPGSADSIDAFSRYVVDYARDHALRDVVLAGHSMGGAIALTIAISGTLPELRGIVAIGSGARLRVAPAILAGLAGAFEATISAVAGYFYESPAAADLEAAITAMRGTGAGQLLADFLACNSFDVLDRLDRITVPVLALTGAADRMTPPKYAQALADRIPGAQARIIDGAGHFVMRERPDATNAAISAFLSENDLA